MKYNQYEMQVKVWLYPGMAGWHFVTLPKDVAEEINARFGDMKRGWGSLPVKVKVGTTSWETSIFPDKESQSYVLPLKAPVRKKEQIKAGDAISLLLEINV